MPREFLSLKSAAAFIGVSQETFEHSAQMYGLKPLVIMGAPMYRTSDIDDVLRKLWSIRELKPQVTQRQIRESVYLTNALMSRLRQGGG